MVAAYFAGSTRARLWTSWCVSRDPAEFLTKLPDEQARGMVARVLGAQGAYAELQPRARERTP